MKSTQKVQPPPISEKKGNENNEEENTAQMAVQKPQSFLNKVLKLKKAQPATNVKFTPMVSVSVPAANTLKKFKVTEVKKITM